MNEEELKRMDDFVNATLKPDKPNEYRLGYEDALRRCYYLVDNLQQRIDKAIEHIKFEWQEIIGNKNYSNHLWTIDGLVIKELLEILGDKENE